MKGIYKKIKDNYYVLSLTDKLILWLRFNAVPVRKLLDIFPVKKGKLLDLGCGHGFISYLFAWSNPDLKVIGIDPSKERIEFANNVHSKPTNLDFKEGKVASLSENDFDVVLAVEVFYLMSEKEMRETLRVCHKKTKNTGVLIIKTMNRSHAFRYLVSITVSHLIARLIRIFGNTGKLFGSRKASPRYYYPAEITKILKETGWLVRAIYDMPLRFFWYPNIIYYCEKSNATKKS